MRPELCGAAPLADDPQVVCPPVVVPHAGQRLAGPLDGAGQLAGELVGARERELDQRLLVVGLDRQHVEADAFRRRRLVQEPVALRLQQGRAHARRGNALEVMHHAPDPASVCRREKIFTSLPTGSKNWSTTRSLSGMIALSVIRIPSGQTAVQHLVMLQ